jgi:hypothetical protein
VLNVLMSATTLSAGSRFDSVDLNKFYFHTCLDTI